MLRQSTDFSRGDCTTAGKGIVTSSVAVKLSASWGQLATLHFSPQNQQLIASHASSALELIRVAQGDCLLLDMSNFWNMW